MMTLTKYMAIAAIFVIALALPPLSAQAAYCPIGDFGIKVPCADEDESPAGSRSFGALVTVILNIFLLAAGSISVIFFMIGGFRYVTASGNEEAAAGAKKTMTAAVIGLIAVIMSFTIIGIITRTLIFGSEGL